MSLRWLGLTALALVLIAVCAFLGTWQYDRYEARAAVNDRMVEAQHDESPADVTSVVDVEEPPASDAAWTRVTATGYFDEDGQILIRNRSVNGKTGYEVVTPLILDDGRAVLVNRGWIPPSTEGALAVPEVPSAPAGEITISGTVHPSEGERGEINTVEGVTQARSINIDLIAGTLSYPVLAGFITDDDPGDGLVGIPVVAERSWQNFAYAYQWWLFAAMIPVGLFVLARRDIRTVAPAQ
ncbi:SURF1-like protein [Stackebrandtia soli]